jgi:hypothetical protein
MQADTVGAAIAGAALTTSPLPALRQVLVVAEDDVDEVVRSTRARIARLALGVRTAEQDADAAEREVRTWEVAAARDFLSASVEQKMESRRLEMARELEQAKAEAARLVLSSRSEAAAILAAASEETRSLLLTRAAAPPPPGGRSLRVVAEAPEPDREPLPALVHAPVASVLVEPEPLADPEPAPEPLVEPAPVPQPAVVVEAAPVVAPAPEPVPVVAPLPVTESVPVVAYLPLASSAPGPASQMATITLPAEAVAQLLADPARHFAGRGAAVGGRRPHLGRFLYLDVLLPMIAVLVVLIVLLAWVG